LQSQSRSQAEACTQAFLKNSFKHHKGLDVADLLNYKAVMLEYSRPKKDKLKKSKGRSRLNARQKRTMKIFKLKPEHQRYELFLPLHELWRQYITDLCAGLKPTSSPQFVQQKLLKADFHGAVLTEVRSKCPSYVGTGILVQEFKHVFKIITKENRLKVIPKRNSVFSVEISGFTSFIYGSRFEQRASERSAKKFKVRGTIDL
uniref:Ribonuclease P protein subunit p29 n=1 Tax=Tetraodon nigroviridis TaxID=99883 RepID=H3CLN9_TETNG